MTTVLPPQTHSQAAYEVLRNRIVSGEFPAGHALSEGELAKELDISRTPLREAIRRLAENGLVDSRPHRQARVVGWNVEKMFSTYTIRAALESEAAGLAAPNVTPEDVEHLSALAAHMETLTDDPLELGRVNAEFHRSITVLSGKETLIRIIESISFQPMLMFSREHVAHVYRAGVHHQHRDIVEALRTKDAEWAAAAMRSHILAGRNAGCIAPFSTSPKDHQPTRTDIHD